VADPVSNVIAFDPQLSDWQRAEMSRMLATTRHLNFGVNERIKALYFRLKYDDPEVADTSVPAAFLRSLIEAAKTGAEVSVPPMSKSDATRISECLRQTAARAADVAWAWGSSTVPEALGELWRSWDARLAVSQDAATRAEYVKLPRGVVG
jgi:hypothetical protein